MNKEKIYESVIIGTGIAGCSLSHFLSKYEKNILLIDKNEDVAFGASGAAGAFLSPLLGKPNKFKELVTKALKFSVEYYKNNFPNEIINCGTVRVPKNKEDEKKFEQYKEFMDFEYKKLDGGYFFEIGSLVNSYNICKNLSKDVEKKFDYEVSKIYKKDDFWFINGEIKTKKLFLCTGADISLIDENYFDIRAVWGQKIDVKTSTKTLINYHKECSLSISRNDIVSIGATHHRIKQEEFTQELIDENCKRLLKLANDIKTLEKVELLDVKIGARASSVDYFPMIGKLVDSEKSFEKYPHIKNGTHIKNENLAMINDLYVINGVGGRGFVLSLYLANQLVENIKNDKELEEEITTFRLFKRWAKKGASEK